MVTKDIPINPDILIWARKEANLSTGRAAIKARITDLKARGEKEGLPSALRLERWEKRIGTPPTFSQLEQLAKAYRRPVITFFLSEPPIKQTRFQDFRTIGNKSIDSEAFSPEFSALLRQIEALQISVHDLLEEAGIKPLPFVGSIRTNSTSTEVAQKIRGQLGYSLGDQRATRDNDQVFTDIRTRAEEQGIFVLLEGNLGSYHTDIEPEVFRGLAISDNLAPFVVVNPNDAKTAMIFTLIHELCHIWHGETGISNWNSLRASTSLPFQNEVFCNQVAAEFLVPETDLLKEWQKQKGGYSTTESINRVSQQFNVSRIVIARRLLDLGQIDEKFYWEFFDSCQEEWQQRKFRTKSSKELKIPYKIRVRSRLGNKLINTVLNAAREGKISELDASRLLNVKINNFAKII